MLYFVGCTESTGNWTGNFTRAVTKGLRKRQVQFRELPSLDWLATDVSVRKYRQIRSRSGDTWFIGWAQSPLIELIRDKPGAKVGLVVGLTAMPFEPAVLLESEAGLREAERLDLYDILFVNSEWCRDCLCAAYPHLTDRVRVTGFPIDYSIYDRFRDLPKDPDLVVFNQRFALEKLHIVEIMVAERLVEMGWKVRHLSGISAEELASMSRSMRPLLDAAGRVGLEFTYNPTKEEYHQHLARASVVVTTSIADMLPSSLIEAVNLGAVPVAPDSMCFPEFIHPDNLYVPYDVDQIVNFVMESPVREHPIDRYDSDVVVETFLREMGLQ
ncbi:MAG: hypothetical protein R6U70_03635 [Bacillota bacterium]